jgi:hypothetical protein
VNNIKLSAEQLLGAETVNLRVQQDEWQYQKGFKPLRADVLWGAMPGAGGL